MTAVRKSQSLNLRIEPENSEMLKRAAEVCGKSLSAFMMEASIYAAQRELLEQRFVRLSADVFDSVLMQIDAPATANAELVRLFRNTPKWTD